MSPIGSNTTMSVSMVKATTPSMGIRFPWPPGLVRSVPTCTHLSHSRGIGKSVKHIARRSWTLIPLPVANEALSGMNGDYLHISATIILMAFPSAFPFSAGMTTFIIWPLFFVARTSEKFSVRNALISSSLIIFGAYSLITE